MGYRSEVVVAFYTRDTVKLPMAALKLWFDENYPKPEDWKPDEITIGNDSITVWYYDIKWYQDYDYVQKVNAATELFTDTFECDENIDSVAAWEIMRVGEELADIEHDGSTYSDYRINVNRTITFE